MFSVFFRESHGFAFARGTVVLLRESRPCLSETKKTCFLFFFFHERHGCDFVRSMGVPLSEREKTRAPGPVFSSDFFVKKSSSKPINMEYSLKDLDARNPTMKAVRDLDTRFER